MSEQHVNTIASVSTGVAQANLTVATFIAAALGGPKSELAKWLEAGNEIDTDIKIPRVYANEFAATCRQKGIPFQFIESSATTEYVTVATRGPGKHIVNEFGEFAQGEDGKRIADFSSVLAGDRKEVLGIARYWNDKYDKAIRMEYRLSPENADEYFTKLDKETGVRTPLETMQVSGLSLEEARLLQDMASKNMIYSYIRNDFGNEYSVEFREEDAVKTSLTGLSPVELSIQQMLMTEARPEVKEWMEINHKNEMDIQLYLYDLKETGKSKPVYIVPLGANSFDTLHNNEPNLLIKIEDNKAFAMETVCGKNPKVKTFNLTKDGDMRLFQEYLNGLGEENVMLKPELFEAAKNNKADFEKYVGVYEKMSDRYIRGMRIATYEAEKLAALNMWETKFKQEFDKDVNFEGNKAITRTIETRIPDSDKMITFLEKGSTDMSEAAATQHLYSTIEENVNRRAAFLHVTTGQKYVTAINSDKTYGPEIEVVLQKEAEKRDFDLVHATDEERAKFYDEYVENIGTETPEPIVDVDHDGIDDRVDALIDLNYNGVDDREEEEYEL